MQTQEPNYASSYAQLRAIAEKFKNGGPSDIDGLVGDFRTARAAYDFCRERLDAIQAEIEAEIVRTARSADDSDQA